MLSKPYDWSTQLRGSWKSLVGRKKVLNYVCTLKHENLLIYISCTWDTLNFQRVKELWRTWKKDIPMLTWSSCQILQWFWWMSFWVCLTKYADVFGTRKTEFFSSHICRIEYSFFHSFYEAHIYELIMFM